MRILYMANITYDNPYNRNLVRKIRSNWERTVLTDPPTEMPMRIASFHDPHAKSLMVGGSRESRYILNGNSPAYPPINMEAVLTKRPEEEQQGHVPLEHISELMVLLVVHFGLTLVRGLRVFLKQSPPSHLWRCHTQHQH